MVLSPILRGMMGLEVNALNGSVTFVPHVPAGWTDFGIKNVKVGSTSLDLAYHNVGEDMILEVTRRGSGKVELTFSPALSPRARVLGADVNGSKVSAKITANDSDQHATISVPITAEKTTLHLRVTANFAIGYPHSAPADGAASSSLKIVSEHWNSAHDNLQFQLAGISGQTYTLPFFKAPSGISVQGASITKNATGLALQIVFPSGPPDTYVPATVTLQFPPN